MPAKFTKTYTSEAEYLYDVATTSDLFDRDLFNELNTKGDGVEFLRAIAGTKNKKSDTFDKEKYNLLHGEDKVNYLVREYYTEDKTSKEYLDSKKYFDAKIAEAIDEKYYTSLTGFQKTVRTIGGILGNMLNSAWSTVEGLIDLGAYAIEGAHRLMGDEEQARLWREAALLDTTGARRFQHTLDNFAKRNSAVSRSAFLSGANDVLTGITQMAPMLAGYALAPVTGGTSIAAGTAVYYGAMAGNTINEELTKNPNINYFKLLAYTAASTGTEMAIESLSGKMFGSTFIDTLAGLNTTKAAVGSLLKRTGLSMLSEGLEEGVAEILGSLTYQIMMDPNAPSATWGDVFYAALIGGLIGGVMEVGGVATSTRYVTTKNDGQLITLAEAKAEGLKPEQYEKVSKIKSSDLFNRMTAYVDRSEEQTEVDKLLAKYNTKYSGNITVETLKQNHKSEYDTAVSKDAEFSEKTAEMVAGISALIEKIGVQSFNKAAELLNYAYATQKERIDLFAAQHNKKDPMVSSVTQERIKQEFERENEGHTINVYNYAQYTQNEKYLAGAIEKLTGKKVAFVKHGSKDGSAFSDVASTEHYVYVEKGVTDKMGTTQVYDKIVKQQLVNEIVNTPGFITSADYKKLFEAVMPVDTEQKTLKQNIKEYLLENVLFDSLTNRRVLHMKFPLFAKLFNKVTKKANETKTDKKLGENERRISYNSLLKVRRTFLNNLKENIHNQEDVEVVTRVMNMTAQESQSFEDGITLPRINQEKYLLTNKTLGRQTADYFMWCSDMAKNIKPEELERSGGEIDFARLLDKTYFTDTFLQHWEESWENETGKSFEEAMWEEAERNGIVINTKNGEVYTKILWSEVLSDKAMDDLEESTVLGADSFEILSKYKTLKDLLRPDAEELFLWSESPENIKIDWFMDLDKNYRGKTTPNADGTITVSWNALADYYVVADTLIHEFVHAIAIENGAIPIGTSVRAMLSFAEALSTDDLFQIARKVYGTKEQFKTREILIDKVSKIFYHFNVGEQIARAEKYAFHPDYDSFYLEENYENDTKTLTGTGVFSKLNGKPFKITLEGTSYTQKAPIISESRTLGIQSELAEKGVKNYEEAGFSKAFAGELNTNPKINKSEIKTFIDSDDIGTEEATNKIIEYYWPNNTNITSVKDINKWLDDTKYAKKFSLFEIAYAYYMRHVNDVVEDSTGKLVSVDKKKTITPKTILLDVVAEKIENGKLYYDKNKVNENKALLASAKDLLNRENNKNNLVSALLDEDLAFTLDSIGNFIKKLQKGIVFKGAQKGVDVVADTVSTSGDEEFSLSDTQAAKEWQEQEESAGETKAEMTAKSLKDNQVKDFTELLSRVGKNEKGFEELDSMLNIKQRIENKGLGNILSEKGYARLLELYTDQETFIDALMDVYTDENGYAIYNKITKTFKDRLISFYGEEKYGEIKKALKELVPEEKSNSVKTVEKLKTKLKEFKTLTNEEKLLVRGDEYKTFTPNQMQEHIKKLEALVEKHKTQQETKTVAEPQKDVKETVEKPKQTKKPDAVVENKAKSPVVKKEQEKVVKPSNVVEEIDEEKEFAQPPEEMPELTKEEKQKAKEQELKITEMKFDKKTQNKVKELLAMMPKEITSEYKGDYYNPTYVSASKRTINDNEAFFESITSEEYQIMRVLLFAEQNEVGDAALVLLDRYAYIKRNSQFKDIAEFIRWNNKRRASTAGSFLGSMSATYGNHTARTFVKELEIKNKTNIEFTDKEVSSVLGEDKESFVEKTTDEIEKLDKQLKDTKDPYEKHKIQQEIDAKNALLDAVEDNDIASVVDIMAKTLDNTDHDQIKNQEKIAKLYSSIVSLAIAKQQEIMAEPAIIGKTGESKVLTALKTLKSFRYLCMLSSPTTWGKNALANTASSAQAIVEDTAAKFLENRENWFLKADTQVNFTGEFNKEFSDYVEKQYRDKVMNKTKGTKYTETALDELRLAYAEATDPLTKSKILSKIKAVEQKMLSDTPWTSRRTMRNLKNMLAGATPQILLQVEYKLKSMYRGKSRIADLTYDTLIKNMKDKNSELLELYIDATNKNSKTSMLSILQLGEKLEVDLLDSDNKNNIFNVAVYRANKLLLKVDNWLTKLRSDLRKKHPVAVELLDFVIPFARTTINTTSYVIDRSPYGLIKGIITALQTRQAQVNDMLKIIENHYKDVYTREVKKTLKDGETFKFDNDKFIKWFETNVDESIRKTLKNTKDKKQIIELYNKMVEDGQIPRGLVLNTNPYARAFAIEQIAQGATGTAVLALGIILAAVADAFEYEDDDDYMGAIIRIGDWKIALNTLTPFSTLFTIGTMLSSGKIDNNLEAAFEVFVDSTILSIVGSAIQYSDNFTDFVKNQTINGLQQYIPAVFKPITKLIDPAKKDKTGSFAEKLIKTSMSNIPGLSYLVPNKINPYTGKTEKYYEKGFLEAFFNIAPVNFRIEDQSELEQTAITLDNKTTGLAGRFEINNKRYDLSGAEKEKYSKYRAEYINKQYNDIVKNGKKVTVKDKNGKLITTTFNKLTNEQKSNVLSSIYSEATSKTRIKYWLDSGNKYYTSNREEYLELRKLFNTTNIRYNSSWKKSKFVEG